MLDNVWIFLFAAHGIALCLGIAGCVSVLFTTLAQGKAKVAWGVIALLLFGSAIGVEGHTVYSENESVIRAKDSVAKIKSAEDKATEVGKKLADAETKIGEKDKVIGEKDTKITELTKAKEAVDAELEKVKDPAKTIADLTAEKNKSDLALKTVQQELDVLKKTFGPPTPPKVAAPVVKSDFDPKKWDTKDYFRVEKNAVVVLKIPEGYTPHVQHGSGDSAWCGLPMAGRYSYQQRLQWTSIPDSVLVYFSRSGTINVKSAADSTIQEVLPK